MDFNPSPLSLLHPSGSLQLSMAMLHLLIATAATYSKTTHYASLLVNSLLFYKYE
jgi:hypothetical protein